MKTVFKKMKGAGILAIIVLSSYKSLGGVSYCPQNTSGEMKMLDLCTLIQPAIEVPSSVVFCSQVNNNKKIETLVLLWPSKQPLIGSYVESDELIPGSTLFAFVSRELKLQFNKSSSIQTKEKFLSLNINQKQYFYRCQK